MSTIGQCFKLASQHVRVMDCRFVNNFFCVCAIGLKRNTFGSLDAMGPPNHFDRLTQLCEKLRGCLHHGP